LVASVAICGDAQATIIDHGDYLTDTTSGLDWLDVTKTANMSYSEALAELGVGGSYEGWRYATGIEFNTLVGNYTGAIIAAFDVRVNQEPNKIDGLVVLLGSTIDAYYMHEFGQSADDYLGYHISDSIGYIADDYDINSSWTAILVDYDAFGYVDFSQAHYTHPDKAYKTYKIGSYLVRNAEIPEPSAVFLMLAAGLGMVGARYSHNSAKG
jgi:hypothetical protein